jgi:hypothetical protein
MIKKFISALRKAGIEPTPEEVADALWYAAQKPFPITSVSGKPSQKRQNLAQKPSQSTESTAKLTEEKQAIQEPLPTEKKHSQPRKSLKLYPTDTDNQKGIPFCTPGASALPGALKLARVLRPLMRHKPSSHSVVLQ